MSEKSSAVQRDRIICESYDGSQDIVGNDSLASILLYKLVLFLSSDHTQRSQFDK